MKRLLVVTTLLIVFLTVFWSCDTEAPGIDVSSVISLAVSGFDFDESTKTADFGTVELGSSSTLTTTIKNTSASSITIDSITNDNTTDYTVTSATTPFTVDAGAEVSFSVVFTPSTNTSLMASITISLSTDVSLSDTITLKGAGNYAPTAVFGITVSDAGTYGGINGFYTKQTDSYDSDNGNPGDDGRPLYKMTSGGTDYFLYYFQPEGVCWGIKDGEPDFNYPEYTEGPSGPIAYIQLLFDSANEYYPNSYYPPEETISESENWVENLEVTNQISIVTGITRTGSTLSASYQFDDPDGDTEGSSTFIWYWSASANGTYTVIPGATSDTYEIDGISSTTYFKVGATPLDSNGFVGTAVISDPYCAYYEIVAEP